MHMHLLSISMKKGANEKQLLIIHFKTDLESVIQTLIICVFRLKRTHTTPTEKTKPPYIGHLISIDQYLTKYEIWRL